MRQRYYLKCIGCGGEYDPERILYTCPKCGDLLSCEYDYSRLPSDLRGIWGERTLSVWRYLEMLPIEDRRGEIISLGEGGTTLNRCRRLQKEFGLRNIYVKNEGENPTGSFKDRGMTVGVTRALQLNMESVICASTGNTSASLAAYAAKAGLTCIVLIPSGKVALGKLVQAIIHGARVIQVRGNFDAALRIARRLSEKHPLYLLNSLNPYRLEGQKTIAYEIVDQLGEAPDKVIVPVGNAGNISAIWKGFKELRTLGFIDNLPEMIGIQAEGAAPIAQAFRRGLDGMRPVEDPETVATAIRIGAPVNWKKAFQALKESNGFMETVSDDEILEAQSLLAAKEGLFVEPASASSIAGLRKLASSKSIDKNERVVCVVTGHGLKDPDIVLRQSPKMIEVDADLESIERIIMIG